MAHYVETEREDIKVVSVNRREAVDLITSLAGFLGKTSYAAPMVAINQHGQLKYYLAFQLED